jgi:hypothetical protein
MEWLPLIILAVVVVAITLIHDRSAARAARDRVAETERILAAFVEQAKDANRNVSGVYMPTPPSAAVPTTIEAYETELARMLVQEDFDLSDPTDQFIKPERTDAVIIGDAGHEDDANPFGIPGLTHHRV